MENDFKQIHLLRSPSEIAISNHQKNVYCKIAGKQSSSFPSLGGGIGKELTIQQTDNRLGCVVF